MLALHAAAADHEAFAELHRRHAAEVYGLCLRLLGDQAAAEEMAQDIFVRAWEQLHHFRGGNFGGWLYTLARRHFLNDARARRRLRRHVNDIGASEEVLDARQPISQETRLTIAAVIDTLPPACRTAFVMHDVEGFSTNEIADALGIAPATVRVQLSRARRTIAEVLRR